MLEVKATLQSQGIVAVGYCHSLQLDYSEYGEIDLNNEYSIINICQIQY